MKPNSDRLFSLDLLRGLDMFLLTVVSGFMKALNQTTPLPDCVMGQLKHNWGGFTLWDIIMPLFIFMCGAAVPFALGRRLDENGRPTLAYWRHVLSRVAILWILGMMAQGRLLTLDLSKISPFNNTLQSIASGYLIAAVVFALPWRKLQIAAPIVLAVLYAALMHFLGDYTKDGNFAQAVENWVVPHIMPAGNRALELADKGYTWWLTILMFGAMTLCGMEATRILTAKWDKKRRFAVLAALGAVLLAVGWAFVPWIPCIKHLYTFTFTAQAMGWCCLALALLYYLTDILMLRRGLWLFTLFGQTALLAYVSQSVFRGVFTSFANQLTQGVPHAFGESARPLLSWLAATALLVAILCTWRAAKRAWKQERQPVTPQT
jgi:predicted acyltransferase